MALKKCKECGHDISSKAKKCPNCGAPIKKRIGCMGLIGIAVIGVIVLIVFESLLRDESDFNKTEQPPTSTDKTEESKVVDKIELNQDQIAVLNKLEGQGLLNLKPDLNTAYINPDLWVQMTIMQKEDLSAAIAIYCGNYKKTYLYHATIYDLMSGKKLAKYSRAWGFKVY